MGAHKEFYVQGSR